MYIVYIDMLVLNLNYVDIHDHTIRLRLRRGWLVVSDDAICCWLRYSITLEVLLR